MNRLRADLILLFVALIWGSAFAVQRVAAGFFDFHLFNGLRFLLGGLILLPFSGLLADQRSSTLPAVDGHEPSNIASHPRMDGKAAAYILIGGVLLFGGAGLQQAGLQTTTAGNAGFITTLYVVLVPILLVLFWKIKITWISWLGAGIAIAGSLLLSTGGRLQFSQGDALEFAGSFLWAFHLILVSRVVKHMDVLTFSCGQYLIAGGLNMLVSWSTHASTAGLSSAWWTIVYIGILSTALGYTLQVFGQKYTPPADATIILSMEAVFAALTGMLFLGERMSLTQVTGAGLILAAVFVTQLYNTRARELSPQP